MSTEAFACPFCKSSRYAGEEYGVRQCVDCGETYHSTRGVHRESGPPGDMLGVRLLNAVNKVVDLEAEVERLRNQNANLMERIGGQSQVITKLVEKIRGIEEKTRASL